MGGDLIGGGVFTTNSIRDTRIMGGKIKKLWAHDGRTARDFYPKLMGGKLQKNNDGHTVGALPKFWIKKK